MQQSETVPAGRQASQPRPARERVGLSVSGADAAAAVASIVAAGQGERVADERRSA